MKKLILSIAIMLLCGTAMAQNAKMPENITIKSLDGKTVTTAVLQNDGKPFVISFWATWCKPCNLELNTIRELYEEWQEETGIKIIAVSIDDSRSASKVKPHVDGNGWNYEVYLDQNRDFARAMNVGADVPYTFIINGEGEIVWMHKGYQPGGEDELIEQYKQVLKGE